MPAPYVEPPAFRAREALLAIRNDLIEARGRAIVFEAQGTQLCVGIGMGRVRRFLGWQILPEYPGRPQPNTERWHSGDIAQNAGNANSLLSCVIAAQSGVFNPNFCCGDILNSLPEHTTYWRR